MIKKFGDLIPLQDSIYSIHPISHVIKEHKIQAIRISGKDDRFVVINYFKDNRGYNISIDKLADAQNLMDITAQVIVPRNNSNVLLRVVPPTVLFTSESELKQWMKNTQ